LKLHVLFDFAVEEKLSKNSTEKKSYKKSLEKKKKSLQKKNPWS
jgi:hypothetical protein